MKTIKRFFINVLKLAALFGLFYLGILYIGVNAAEACTDEQRWEDRSQCEDQDYTPYDATRGATDAVGGFFIGAFDIIGGALRGGMDAISSVSEESDPEFDQRAAFRRERIAQWAPIVERAGVGTECHDKLLREMSPSCLASIESYLAGIIEESKFVIAESEKAIEVATEDLRAITDAQADQN